MASDDIKEALKAAAIQIRDEKQAGANTAMRVGSLLLAICEALGISLNESEQNKNKLERAFFERLFIAVDAEGKEIPSDDITTPVAYIKAKYNFASIGGITSFAMGEEVNVPQIYDGLPIDNQTLYWEEVKEEVGTDEEGNPIYETTKVLKAAGGGGGTGGGGVADSVQYPLSWSGFSEDSWDGSEAKTIQIPWKLSDLDGDVIVFKEDGWGDAFRIKPYFSGSGDDNYLAIERSVGGSGEEPFFNDCLKIRGQTGKIEHVCTNETALSIQHLSDNHWSNAFLLMNPTMAEGRYEQFQIGKEMSPYNCGNIGFQFFGDGKWENLMTIGLNGADNILNVTGWKRVGINTSAPRHDLEVNGQIGVTNNIKLYGREYDDVEFVNNDDGCITNVQGALNTSIRHALRFNWYGDSYEIGAVRGGGAEARGFGVTYGNHTLIFEVGVGGCDFHTPVYLRQGLYVQGSAEFVDNVKFDKPTNFIGNAGDNNISFVYNEDGVITNKTYDAESIRHALRFQWFQDAYEIGAVRTGWGEAFGFGVTYNNNLLVWKVNRERMDVYGDLRIKNGLIRYNETEGYFYLDGNLVVSGGLTAFADEGAGNQWIMDVNSLEEVVSDNPFKTYSAKVVSMIASNITNTEEVKIGVKEALDKLEIIEEGFFDVTVQSTLSQLRDMFISIRSKLSTYGSNYS